jgi:hypothetical protein
MTEDRNNMKRSDLPFDFLESQWDRVAKHASEIAEEIDIKSEGTSGNFRLQTLAISEFFRNSCNFEKSLGQPYVLAIANPLARFAAGGPLNRTVIASAVHTGLCTIARHGSTHRNLVRIFLYPILLTYFVVFASIFAAHFMLGPFEELYREFGIQLPAMTLFIIRVGFLIRTYTFTVLIVFLGLPPLLWLLNWIGRETREPGMSRLDLLFSTKRMSAARFLFHVSLLLEAGLSKDDAIAKATSVSGKNWLKRRHTIRQHKTAHQSDQAKVRFFDRVFFRSGDTALAAPRSRGKVVLLQQVATWYRDTSSNIIEWLVQLVIPLYVFAILFGSFILVVSLLMPLIAIISGLTGGGGAPGGVM